MPNRIMITMFVFVLAALATRAQADRPLLVKQVQLNQQIMPSKYVGTVVATNTPRGEFIIDFTAVLGDGSRERWNIRYESETEGQFNQLVTLGESDVFKFTVNSMFDEPTVTLLVGVSEVTVSMENGLNDPNAAAFSNLLNQIKPSGEFANAVATAFFTALGEAEPHPACVGVCNELWPIPAACANPQGSKQIYTCCVITARHNRCLLDCACLSEPDPGECHETAQLYWEYHASLCLWNWLFPQWAL